MLFTIHEDGSYDISHGGIALRNAYPALDGRAVRPLRVKAEKDSATYVLPGAELAISFAYEDGLLALRTRCTGRAPHDVMPLAFAECEGTDRAFRQGLGIGGPSGFVKAGEDDITSHSLVAVGNEEECLAVYAREQGTYDVCCRLTRDSVLSAGFVTENIPLRDDAVPALYIRAGEGYSDTLEACARDIAREMNARQVTRQGFHWCSWYYLYHNLDQGILEDYLEGFAAERALAPFTHIQIDAGYFPSCGDWLETNERFPKGLKYAADTILKAGYGAGLWIAPYMVGDHSRLYREHPDWVLKGLDGKPYVISRQYNEPKIWGYIDTEYYVLDTSHPDAMEYIRRVFTTLREWGFTLFKTDFLLWGLHDSSKVKRYAPGKTSFEYIRDMLKVIRSAIGEDARWLGCIAPFMPCVGYMDMMRIAGDVGAQWDENSFGPANMLNELTADQYFNNIYWQNDPDAVMLRDFHIYIESPQIEALAVLEAMSGGTMYTSDPVHLLGEERKKLLRFIRPDEPRRAKYPCWGDMRGDVCLVQETKTHTLVYFFNASKHDAVREVDWKELTGDRSCLYKWHAGPCEARDERLVRIPAREGVLYFASKEPIEKGPENMWTV